MEKGGFRWTFFSDALLGLDRYSLGRAGGKAF